VSGTDSETPRTRWNRSQRFQLSPAGRKAGLNYRQVIVASRAEAGRKSFDVARTEWAARLGLEPTDGLYLGLAPPAQAVSGPPCAADWQAAAKATASKLVRISTNLPLGARCFRARRYHSA